MAVQAHIDLVRRGARELELWRKENPSAVLDLREAVLEYVNLRVVDLSHADFTHASLVGCDLQQANLSSANFNSAFLRDLTLDHAVCLGTGFAFSCILFSSFRNATLKGAQFFTSYCYADDFTDANLEFATLGATAFSTCNFRGARLENALAARLILSDTDFSTAHGLDKIRIQAPMSIGMLTMARSFPLPNNLVVAAGYSPEVLECFEKTISDSYKYYEAIIPYASLEKPFTDRLFIDLPERNVRCWEWQNDPRWGQALSFEIDETIKGLDKTLIICSENTLGHSAWRNELAWALDHDARKAEHPVLLTIILDNSVFEADEDMIARLAKNPFIDMRDWTDSQKYSAALDQLVLALRRPGY